MVYGIIDSDSLLWRGDGGALVIGWDDTTPENPKGYERILPSQFKDIVTRRGLECFTASGFLSRMVDGERAAIEWQV